MDNTQGMGAAVGMQLGDRIRALEKKLAELERQIAALTKGGRTAADDAAWAEGRDAAAQLAARANPWSHLAEQIRELRRGEA